MDSGEKQSKGKVVLNYSQKINREKKKKIKTLEKKNKKRKEGGKRETALKAARWPENRIQFITHCPNMDQKWFLCFFPVTLQINGLSIAEII